MRVRISGLLIVVVLLSLISGCIPGKARNHYNVGEILEEKGDLARSLEEYELAVHYYPVYKEALYRAGSVGLAIEEYDRASVYFQSLYDLDPEYEDVILKLATSYERRGLRSRAIKLYSTAIEKNPGDMEQYLELGHCYREAGNTRAAIATFNDIIEMDPSYLTGYIELAGLYSDSGDYDQAIRSCQKALVNHPENPEIWKTIALISEEMNDLEGSLSAYETLHSISFSARDAALKTAEVCHRFGMYDRAIEQYRQSLQIDPTLVGAYFSLGEIHADRGEFDLAISNLQKAIELQPEDAEAHELLFLVYSGMGEFEKALNQFQQYLSYFPDGPSKSWMQIKLNQQHDTPPTQ